VLTTLDREMTTEKSAVATKREQKVVAAMPPRGGNAKGGQEETGKDAGAMTGVLARARKEKGQSQQR